MARTSQRVGAETLSRAAHPLDGSGPDLDPLLELIGDARLVLLGEASHGTQEFYEERARITRRLIEEKDFGAVAVEADWPDAYRVNCYVRRSSGDPDAERALGDFLRFPTWMWRNHVVADFVEWLRGRDGGVGFYGLDLYSLYRSVDAVIDYLDEADPEAAGRARERYGCLDLVRRDPQAYGLRAVRGERCEDEVLEQLLELRARVPSVDADGDAADDHRFYAEQNARLVAGAEAYYRQMFAGGISTWNLRDRHMADTLDALVEHLERREDGPVKVVVWAHNSHLGDARATEMGDAGELNLGQLVRERHATEAFLVGFSTYTGTVTAASNWDGRAERKRVRPGLEDSYEAILHDVDRSAFLLSLQRDEDAAEVLRPPRLERAIGVIYRPQTERQSHYFRARLPEQFDAVVHIDETAALEPLDPTSVWLEGAPETFPHGT